jgi:hypothetical protein
MVASRGDWIGKGILPPMGDSVFLGRGPHHAQSEGLRLCVPAALCVPPCWADGPFALGRGGSSKKTPRGPLRIAPEAWYDGNVSSRPQSDANSEVLKPQKLRLNEVCEQQGNGLP